MEKALVYKADDRSILLPYYKRFCVEPTLPFIPDALKERFDPDKIEAAANAYAARQKAERDRRDAAYEAAQQQPGAAGEYLGLGRRAWNWLKSTT